WSAAWEMTRDAEFKARDFVALVCRGLPAETEVGVVQRVLLQAQTALSSYADQEWAASEGWPTFTAAVLAMARAAEPGSDHQLAFVNALTGSVLDSATVDFLAGLYDGSATLDGLTVDTDLRWRLLHALVAHGRAEKPEIEAELARDNTATGRRHAERALALRPTAEAKAEAWQRAVHDDELPNAINDAIIAGFSHPGQKHLLGDYVKQYFEVVDDVWSRRTSERAQAVVVGLFPSWEVEESTVAAADEWLSAERPAARRRLVTGGRATVVRCLAARDCDRG